MTIFQDRFHCLGGVNTSTASIVGFDKKYFFYKFFVFFLSLIVKSVIFVTLRRVMLRSPLGQGGRLLPTASLLVCAVLAVGCGTIVKKTAKGVTSLATGTVKIAGKATGTIAVATIKTGGQVAISVGKASGRALLDLAKAGAVTFVDAATGLVSSIPFVDGMSLNVALAAAKLDPRLKIFEIIRPEQILRVAWKQLAKLGGAKLRSGDVIRVIQLATR